MRVMRWCSAFFVLTACRSLPSAEPLPARPELQHLQSRASEATTLATSLCDSAGPRLSGSPGSALAVTWAVETMTRLGLSNVHTEPVTVPHWVRGLEEAAVVSPGVHPLAVTALGGSIATPDGGVEAEVVEVSSLAVLKALDGGSLAGKILFANVPMRRAVDGSGYGETAGVRRLAPIQGAMAGAVAVVIRSVGTDVNRLPHTGALGAEASAIPAAALSIPDAELVHRLLSAGPVRLRLRLTPRLEAPAQGANVVGDVPGREEPGQVVLLGAHLDSWDLGTGALDDGAGVGVILDAAHALLGLTQRPRRTVRVVLFANEENGLAGAKAYAAAHAAELPQHVAALEIDAGGGMARSVRVLAQPSALAAVQAWEPSLAPLSVHVETGSAEGGADTSVLRAAGVPQLDVRQDVSQYFDVHHTANDTVDKIDPVQLTQLARTTATVAWLAAEQGIDFGRVPEPQRTRAH